MRTPSRASLRSIAVSLLSVILFVSAFLSSMPLGVPSVSATAVSFGDTAGYQYMTLQAYHSTRLVMTTHLVYRAGYSLQGAWWCYGWPSGVYHCTERWEVQSGQIVSLHPTWVPVASGGSVPLSHPVTVPRNGTFNTGLGGQPCRAAAFVFPRVISSWTVPEGCFGRIFWPSPHNYVARPSYGWCNWWPEVLHPAYSGSTVLHLPSHRTPIVGAVVWFSGGVQGASWAGHYAQVVAISPNGYWLLITEMNFAWRGGGWQRVDYRFVHIGAGVSFRYV